MNSMHLPHIGRFVDVADGPLHVLERMFSNEARNLSAVIEATPAEMFATLVSLYQDSLININTDIDSGTRLRYKFVCTVGGESKAIMLRALAKARSTQ